MIFSKEPVKESCNKPAGVPPEIRRQIKAIADLKARDDLQAVKAKDALMYVETAMLQYLIAEEELMKDEFSVFIDKGMTEVCKFFQSRLGVINEMVGLILKGGMRHRIADMEASLLAKRIRGLELMDDDPVKLHLQSRLRVLKRLRERLCDGRDKDKASKMARRIPFPNTRKYRRVKCSTGKF